MCHRGGEIDQDALLKTELLKTKDMVDKEIYNELSKRFLQLEKHCISLEIQIQQKEESFQSNKPCKNQEFPEFREFFVINDLKAQLLARTTLICNLKKQIKSVKETSNEAKVKNNIDVIETINIELEHSVAKLLAANEQLHKENEHLKQTYKELFDSIKKTKVQNKDNSESLISQINQKSVENANLKAQIQEKVFANAALNNELRKLKGNIVDSKFAKASILGKPPLQPSRNHLVVRQPNAFTSERPRITKTTVWPPSWIMTQDKTGIPSHKDMASTRAHCTPNACTPKPRNIYRSSPVSKCSGGMSNGQRFSLNKSSAVHEKQHTPRSCLRWKPTGRIFKTVSLRWIPTGKMFTDSTTKVDSEPPNGSNDDITNPYECNQTLYFSAGTSNSSAGHVHCIKQIPLSTPQLFWNTLTHDGKTSLTEAEEEDVARAVHATPCQELCLDQTLEPAKDQTVSNDGKLHVVSLLDQTLSNDDDFLATAYPKVHENLKLITDERVIKENPESHSGSMSSMKNLDDTYNFGDQFLYDKPTKDDQEKSKVIEESDSTIPDPSHQTVTSTPPVIAPFTDVSSSKPSSLVTPLPINTEATTITTSLPEITPFIALQLRVANEQEILKSKDDHGKSTKRRRHDSGASGSAQPPTKDDEQSSKKPRKSDASASKQHPALPSTGWKITDTRDADVDSSMHRSDPESEQSEQSSDNIPMQDEGHVSDLEDTDNAHIPKVSTTTWFKPIPEGERPATPEPE
ncbi:hypothetical protein Tco_1310542 [Tanacetum coccineum]